MQGQLPRSLISDKRNGRGVRGTEASVGRPPRLVGRVVLTVNAFGCCAGVRVAGRSMGVSGLQYVPAGGVAR